MPMSRRYALVGSRENPETSTRLRNCLSEITGTARTDLVADVPWRTAALGWLQLRHELKGNDYIL
jgi:hypothetical protein